VAICAFLLFVCLFSCSFFIVSCCHHLRIYWYFYLWMLRSMLIRLLSYQFSYTLFFLFNSPESTLPPSLTCVPSGGISTCSIAFFLFFFHFSPFQAFSLAGGRLHRRLISSHLTFFSSRAVAILILYVRTFIRTLLASWLPEEGWGIGGLD